MSSHIFDGLGTFQGLIPEHCFDLQQLVEANGGPSETKVYMYLTASKVNTKLVYYIYKKNLIYLSHKVTYQEKKVIKH